MATTTLQLAGEDIGCRRQLDERRSGGITIGLYWDEFDGQLSITVTDDADPAGGFTVEVSADEAAFAFAHPFLFEPERLRVPSAWTAPDEDDVDFDHDPFERA
jgi:hypothetical protein